MLFKKIIFGVFLIFVVLSPSVFGQENEMMKNDAMNKEVMTDKRMVFKINKDDDGVAIKGYDPVAYFTDGKPTLGTAMNSYKWMNAVWYFSSEENLGKFKQNPEMYAPKYGGYCAYGASRNYLVKIDPDAWTIIDNKLYLNYSMSVSETFNADPSKYIMKADDNWPELSKPEMTKN